MAIRHLYAFSRIVSRPVGAAALQHIHAASRQNALLLRSALREDVQRRRVKRASVSFVLRPEPVVARVPTVTVGGVTRSRATSKRPAISRKPRVFVAGGIAHLGTSMSLVLPSKVIRFPWITKPIGVDQFMATDLDVFNIAGCQLGVPPIISVDEDSPAAAKMRSVFDAFKRSYLADHHWNGAKLTAELSESSVAPIARWGHKYILPANHLKVIALNGFSNERSNARWEIEGSSTEAKSFLLTDSDEAIIEYIADVDVGRLSPMAIKAMGITFAYFISPSFPKNPALMADLRNKARLANADAKAIDGQEGTSLRFRRDRLIRARRRGRLSGPRAEDFDAGFE